MPAFLRFPKSVQGGGLGPTGAMVIFQPLATNGAGGGALNDAVSIFLPQGFVVGDGVTYQTPELGLVGGALSNVDMSSLSSQLSNFIDGAGQANGGELASTLAGSMLGQTGIGAGIRSQTGLGTNPNVIALFDRVNLRNFVFNFRMIPTSQEEADSIAAIVKLFRTELYPEEINVGDVPVGYKFPNKFSITVLSKSKSITGKFKECYLQQVQTTYNPSTMTYFTDGSPFEVDLNLTFIESETLSRQDLEAGF
jgi:hypothetical protein